MKKVHVNTLRRRVTLGFCLVLALLFFDAINVNAQQSPFILVLSSQESEPYAQARKAFEKHLAHDFPKAEFLYHHVVQGKDIDSFKVLSDTGKQPLSVIFSLGTSAAEFAQAEFPGYPMVAAMLLDDSVIQQKTEHTGILLHFPAGIQLLWLSKFLPHAKRIGILYDPALNSDLVKEAEKAAQELGLKIIAFEAGTAPKLQAGLEYVSKRADVLLAIPDQTVYSGKTAKQVLLFTYRNRIPFVGLSAPWVKAGALYALEVDYRDLGRQSAEIIKERLDGVPVQTSTTYPERVTYSINRKSMDHLHLEIDPELIKGAVKIFD